MSKYNEGSRVGETVKILDASCLPDKTHCGYQPSMKKHVGKKTVVTAITERGNLTLEGIPFYWAPNWVEECE